MKIKTLAAVIIGVLLVLQAPPRSQPVGRDRDPARRRGRRRGDRRHGHHRLRQVQVAKVAISSLINLAPALWNATLNFRAAVRNPSTS
jgi:hypothetical protein